MARRIASLGIFTRTSPFTFVQNTVSTSTARTGDLPVRADEFSAVVHRHYGALQRCARAYLREDAEAEDVVQSVLERTWRGAHTWNDPDHLLSYVFRAVTNESLNRLKRRRRRSLVEARIETDFERADDALTPPDASLQLSQLEFAFERSVTRLPDARRRIFELHRYGGLTYREIAERLGISIKTVETQMGRALKMLYEDLRDHL
jgi:RNA polymerase sigma-70 factor, ECF subfamily